MQPTDDVSLIFQFTAELAHQLETQCRLQHCGPHQDGFDSKCAAQGCGAGKLLQRARTYPQVRVILEKLWLGNM